jgi:programmed cell death 6-interacting protein
MDILDDEASEDEAACKNVAIVRQRSHEANQELVTKERQYRANLEQAAASDELVRRKWDQWEARVRELTWDEASPNVSRVSDLA